MDSTLGSDELLRVGMYDKDGKYLSYVVLQFSSPMQYQIRYCSNSNTVFPVQPPVEVDKIWTISKTDAALIITCNGVEVLNYQFADSSNSECVTRLGGNVVEQIKFNKNDVASDFYRAVVGTNLNFLTHYLVQSKFRL
eukprot:sb/3474435/